MEILWKPQNDWQASLQACVPANKTACVLVCLRVSNQARGSLNGGGHDYCIDEFQGVCGQVHTGGASGRLVAGTKRESVVGGCRRTGFVVGLAARGGTGPAGDATANRGRNSGGRAETRSEEHTSELQSLRH